MGSVGKARRLLRIRMKVALEIVPAYHGFQGIATGGNVSLKEAGKRETRLGRRKQKIYKHEAMWLSMS